MSDESYEPEWLKLGVASALTRQYSSDQRMFLELLVSMLESVLPGEFQIERKGGLFTKKKGIEKIILPLGENVYTLEDPGHGNLQATRKKVVRGIALKTELISVEEWVKDLGSAIDSRARESSSAREALSHLVE